MVVDLPLQLLIPRVLQSYELDQRVKGCGLFFVDDFLLEANDRGFDDELGLCGETGHNFVESLVLDEVFEVQGQFEFVVPGEFWLEDDVECVDGLGLDFEFMDLGLKTGVVDDGFIFSLKTRRSCLVVVI